MKQPWPDQTFNQALCAFAEPFICLTVKTLIHH